MTETRDRSAYKRWISMCFTWLAIANPAASQHDVSEAAGVMTFAVVNTNDAGAGSLRDAITLANTVTAPNIARITFNIQAAGPHVITPHSDLPVITPGPVIIDGYSQPNAVPATAMSGASLKIVIDTSNVQCGIVIRTKDSRVAGLAIHGSGKGLCVRGDGNHIIGNHIGMDAGGAMPLGIGGDGLEITGNANVVGGATAPERNVISAAAGNGIWLEGNANHVEGNRIGLDANGVLAFGNGQTGVRLEGNENRVLRNVIADNAIGVSITGTANVLKGNLIGTDASGSAALGNDTGVSVEVATSTLIGGPNEGDGNIVSGSANEGLDIDSSSTRSIIMGNSIGTDITGDVGLPNETGMDLKGTHHRIGGTNPGEGNIIAGNEQHGIDIEEDTGELTDGIIIQGNRIGLSKSGNALGNGEVGIEIEASGTTHIGGTSAGAANVIVANDDDGVRILSKSTLVQGNFIGVTKAGAALGNAGAGIKISGDDNLIGGPGSQARNVIGGNAEDGIAITGAGNRVLGNSIGIGPQQQPLGNQGSGVLIASGERNQVGSSHAGDAQNVIAFNGADGVSVTGGTNHAIGGNAIFANLDLGIDLGVTGVLMNDKKDADGGDNDLQNYPVLKHAHVDPVAGTTEVKWNLWSEMDQQYRIEFFSHPNCGNGEASQFLGAIVRSSPMTHVIEESSMLPIVVPLGHVIVATATHLRAPLGPTSEFSACVVVN